MHSAHAMQTTRAQDMYIVHCTCKGNVQCTLYVLLMLHSVPEEYAVSTPIVETHDVWHYI